MAVTKRYVQRAISDVADNQKLALNLKLNIELKRKKIDKLLGVVLQGVEVIVGFKGAIPAVAVLARTFGMTVDIIEAAKKAGCETY